MSPGKIFDSGVQYVPGNGDLGKGGAFLVFVTGEHAWDLLWDTAQ